MEQSLKKDLQKALENSNDQSIGDMYDIVKAVMKVHTKDTPLNQDYTLSNLKEESKQQKFIRQRIRTADVCYNFMLTYDEEGKIIKESKDYAEKIRQLMMSDCVSIANLSRSNEGAVLKAVLGAIEQKQEIVQEVTNEPTPETKGLLGKLRKKV